MANELAAAGEVGEAEDAGTESAAATTAPEAGAVDDKAISDQLMAEVLAWEKVRKQKSVDWKINVERRLGTPGANVYTGGLAVDATSADGQSTINPDWYLTKTKTANLFSIVPEVQLTPAQEKYGPAIYPFQKALNFELSDKRADIGVPVDEVLNDVVNASGIGAVMVGYTARFETTKVAVEESITAPSGATAATKDMTLEQLQQLEAAGLVHLKDAQKVISYKFFINRISPIHLLVPAGFTGSLYDNADWVGFEGEYSWADAQANLKLTEAQRSQVLGNNTPETSSQSLRGAQDQQAANTTPVVRYKELYYWRARQNANELNLQAIWKVVFVAGLTEPVIHEAWKGQQTDPMTHKMVGCTKFPVRVLTLTYITDNAVPPSDSQAGRPQVDDMRRSRGQMFMNRERSIPIRWFDVNRIDTTVADTLMRGTWQGMIPTNGDGARSIGEIARASYPAEDMSFDRKAEEDLRATWQIGPNQGGTAASGDQTAAAANITQQGFQTVMGQEQNKVRRFFLSIVEVLAGWMALYSDFPSLADDERQAMMQAWDDKQVLHDLVFKIRPGSQIVQSAEDRIKQLSSTLNLTVQSGFVNPEPLIIEIMELSNLDPQKVMVKPTPKNPDLPNLSFRFTGKDDMQNSAVVALLAKAGLLPSLDEVKKAQEFLLAASQPPAPAQPGMSADAAPAGAPDGVPPTPGAPANGVSVTPQGGLSAHPDWHLTDKVAKRGRDI
jgi:hypothetical protein